MFVQNPQPLGKRICVWAYSVEQGHRINSGYRAFRGHTSPTAELTRTVTGYTWCVNFAMCVAATLPHLATSRTA